MALAVSAEKEARRRTAVEDADNPALVDDFRSSGVNVYLKDIRLTAAGHPVILIVTSGGYEAGPKNDPRTWTLVRWTGDRWRQSPITTSDNNYDMGSLYLDQDCWRVIAPTEPGPQSYNPGGEVALWVSEDGSRTWTCDVQLTTGSSRNHTYVRRPVNAHPDFYAFWADGHGRQPSESRLYFCNRQGDVFLLPRQMDADFATPRQVH